MRRAPCTTRRHCLRRCLGSNGGGASPSRVMTVAPAPVTSCEYAAAPVTHARLISAGVAWASAPPRRVPRRDRHRRTASGNAIPRPATSRPPPPRRPTSMNETTQQRRRRQRRESRPARYMAPSNGKEAAPLAGPGAGPERHGRPAFGGGAERSLPECRHRPAQLSAAGERRDQPRPTGTPQPEPAGITRSRHCSGMTAYHRGLLAYQV